MSGHHLKRGKKTELKDMMKVLSRVPLGTCISHQIEKLMILFMIQDHIEDVECNLDCVQSFIMNINVADIDSHIEILCNIIQSHGKEGKTNIAYSIAKQCLRKAAVTKAHFPQRLFLASSPMEIKSACTSLLTFVAYAWRGLKSLHCAMNVYYMLRH